MLLPIDYYENSFKLISQAGMNHVRYVFYWEAYETNPSLFMKELETVARTADKYGLNILYDNHQYHTSSWLDPKNGTCLFA
jgi:aryl-phospho-beta-D-glucosidase BglC (GH1 family)